MRKSNEVPLGRYVFGGKVTDYKVRLGWWDKKIFTKSLTDVAITVESKYNMRPDLMAYDLYDKASLMWLILQYNNILDVTEFVEGLELILPTKYRVYHELLTKRM